MTDALAIIEQTEPRVLPAAQAFVLTTLDQELVRAWMAEARKKRRAQAIATLAESKDWRVEVWPTGRGDL